MTTHETLFFRDPNVFDALRGDLLPSLIRERQSSQTLRIWCAACSSGQEPYSIAMMLSELGCASWNIHLFATDISTKILDRAATGRFLQIEVNRGLPASLLVKYFQRVGLDWQIKDEVRRMVRFAPLDLRWNMGGLGPFDLILCRNVLIYFEIETRRKILGGLRGTLQPGGFLLLGASETTWNLDDTWQRHTLRNTVFYRNPTPGVIQ